jgi:hypothetical protein
LEFTCWNGEIVRIAFVLDCHDREVIALAPKTGDGRKAPLNEKRLTHWFYLYPGDACHGW